MSDEIISFVCNENFVVNIFQRNFANHITSGVMHGSDFVGSIHISIRQSAALRQRQQEANTHF